MWGKFWGLEFCRVGFRGLIRYGSSANYVRNGKRGLAKWNLLELRWRFHLKMGAVNCAVERVFAVIYVPEGLGGYTRRFTIEVPGQVAGR